jgi:hypothetical protein
MTPLTKTVLIAGLAFLVGSIGGAVAGGSVAIYFTAGFFADGFMLGQAVNAQTKVAVLRQLRTNQPQKAIELLETHLDGDIIGLKVDNKYAPSTNDSVKKAISRARDYRVEYPRKTGLPEVDAGVRDVLNSHQDGQARRP